MKRENSAGADYSERLFSVSDIDDGASSSAKTDVGGIVNSVYEILKDKDISEAENIGALLGKLLTSRPRLFYGKMTMNNKGRYGVSFKGINLIPGLYYPSVVSPTLLSFCGDGDDFGYRMFETVTRVYRSKGANQTVVMFTPLWDQSVYRRVATDIENQKDLFGTRYVFILVSDKGAVEIKV
jgi:hypothetical protein